MENNLDEETQKVIFDIIQEVLSGYVSQSKLFNADILHSLRSSITNKVHEKLGEECPIEFVDVGINLEQLQDIPFFFQMPTKNDDKTE